MNWKTKPFPHQLAEWERSRDSENRAIFWEQGTGKTKLILDTAQHLALEKKIDGLLVIAPNGVHDNWTQSEVPNHFGLESFEGFAYHSRLAKTRKHKEDLDRLFESNRFAVLAMSYDSLITDSGKAIAKRFLTSRRCLYVLDESTRIKSPSAIRTKVILASAQYAAYRRVLTGTPIANGPFDIFAPMKFLDPAFWKGRGWGSFTAFKAYFGVYKKGYASGGREFPQLVGYRNIDRLSAYLEPHMSRVTKDEVLDLPPKLFTTLKFELDPLSRRCYDTLRDEYMLLTGDGNVILTAPIVLKRLLRLQQITCGYVPIDFEEPTQVINFDNNRLRLLGEVIQEISHGVIIWARFRFDIDLIIKHLLSQGKTVVRYDGSVKSEDRIEAIRKFQSGEAQFFVANPAAAGEGLTLHAARTVIYYSNSFKFAERLQSEDRAHRIGQEHPVHYIDLIANDTIDGHIVRALRRKSDVARLVTGDQFKEWLSG